MIYFLFAIIFLVLCTSIGSLLVLLLNSGKKVDLFFNFSVGVMISSVFYSLIIKSFEISKNLYICALLILMGTLFMILFKRIFSNTNSITTFTLSMYIHNIPEGMSVGILFASYILKKISLLGFLSFALGIGLQNIADGFSISSVLNKKGKSKKKSVTIGLLSGFVEPISALIGYYLVCYVNCLLPYLLAIAGGICLFVILDDLISDLKIDDKSSFAFIVGFILIILLDFWFE